MSSVASVPKQRSKAFWPMLVFVPGWIGTALGLAAAYVSPEKIPALALMGLVFPLSSGLLLLGTAAICAVRRWKLGGIGALLVLLSWSHITSSWGGLGLRGSDSMVPAQTSLRVMSWNVRQFNRFGWIEDASVRDSMLAYLARQEADVICLQECFLEDRRSPWMSAQRLKDATGLPHWSEEFKLGRGHDKLFGLAVMSRYPVVGKEAIHFENDKNNSAMYVDLLVNGDTVRVYNVHLSSIGFEKADYEAARDVGNEANRNRLLDRLAHAWTKRAQQSELLANHIESSPHPVILTGDFNDTPVSYATQRMRRALRDAYGVVRPSGGSWLGATYAGDWPFLRIDQCWADPELEVNAYQTDDIVLSDHRPIQVVFSWD